MSFVHLCIAVALLSLSLMPGASEARTAGAATGRPAAESDSPSRANPRAARRSVPPQKATRGTRGAIRAGVLRHQARPQARHQAQPRRAKPYAGAPLPAGIRAASSTPAGDGFDRLRSVSLGDAIGLHRTTDPLDLRSGSVLVMDRDNGKVLYSKNTQYVLPIASLTKVMTSMVVLDGGQPLDEPVTITGDDRDLDRHSSSRLPIGTRLTRRELIALALMASENRAAAALARTYPGGTAAFVGAANRKAKELGMVDSTFADGTGLSSANVSTAGDLARMIAAAARYPLVRQASVSPSLAVRLAAGERTFHTTNRLVAHTAWDLELQKTGYISEAGNCLLLLGKVQNRSLIVVLLDSYGRYSRIADAERIRRWLATQAIPATQALPATQTRPPPQAVGGNSGANGGDA